MSTACREQWQATADGKTSLKHGMTWRRHRERHAFKAMPKHWSIERRLAEKEQAAMKKLQAGLNPRLQFIRLAVLCRLRKRR